MARFKFFMIGSREAPVVEVEAANLRELCEEMKTQRFILGHIAEADHDGVCPGVMMATSRIQLIIEEFC